MTVTKWPTKVAQTKAAQTKTKAAQTKVAQPKSGPTKVVARGAQRWLTALLTDIDLRGVRWW